MTTKKQKEIISWRPGTQSPIHVIKQLEELYLVENGVTKKYGVAWIDGNNWRSYTYTPGGGYWIGSLSYVVDWVSRNTAYKRYQELVEQKKMDEEIKEIS